MIICNLCFACVMAGWWLRRWRAWTRPGSVSGWSAVCWWSGLCARCCRRSPPTETRWADSPAHGWFIHDRFLQSSCKFLGGLTSSCFSNYLLYFVFNKSLVALPFSSICLRLFSDCLHFSWSLPHCSELGVPWLNKYGWVIGVCWYFKDFQCSSSFRFCIHVLNWINQARNTCCHVT